MARRLTQFATTCEIPRRHRGEHCHPSAHPASIRVHKELHYVAPRSMARICKGVSWVIQGRPESGDNLDKAEAEKRYRDTVRPLCDVFGRRLAAITEDLCSTSGIAIAHIDTRAKSVDSFLGKADRKAYTEPLAEMKDLCGVRGVTYYQDDVARAVAILSEEFAVDGAHSLDKAEELDVDEFGYRSVHLVVALKEPRSTLAEWKPFVELTAEIQVRSVLQHAWAAISHKL